MGISASLPLSGKNVGEGPCPVLVPEVSLERSDLGSPHHHKLYYYYLSLWNHSTPGTKGVIFGFFCLERGFSTLAH